MMRHPMDRSPRVIKAHLWELEGERHLRCSICWLVVPQDAASEKSLPICRPDGVNEAHCVAGPWVSGDRSHSDGWYDHTGDCAWCGAPTELPRPGFLLPESNCLHGDIDVRASVAVCGICGKRMHGW